MSTVIVIIICGIVLILGLVELAIVAIDYINLYVWYTAALLLYIGLGIFTVYLRNAIEQHPRTRCVPTSSFLRVNFIFWCWWLVIWWYVPVILYLKFGGEVGLSGYSGRKT